MPILTAAPLHPPGFAFPTGATASPKERAFGTPAFEPARAAPPEVIVVPKQLSYWGNDRYGICVTSQEAFSKACHEPEVFWPEVDVIAWARKYGWLNGANLSTVMDRMISTGFSLGSQKYFDGPYKSVNWSDIEILKAAIAVGPVNIAINANALPSGAGSQQGWWILGPRSNRNTNHCVALSSYGTADRLFKGLDVPLPASLPASTFGFLLFTWSTIGFVDHKWLLGTCDEAWVRNPTTVGDPPLPDPKPPGPTPQPTQPQISGSLFAEPYFGGIAIRGELTLPASTTNAPSVYIAVPNGAGGYKLQDKAFL